MPWLDHCGMHFGRRAAAQWAVAFSDAATPSVSSARDPVRRFGDITCFWQVQSRARTGGAFLPSSRVGAGGWVEEASSKPVSQDTLAGIPWAGRSTLTGLFLRVAATGPHDAVVWKRLAARADVIAHSLTPKQAALMLSAMARAQQRQEPFLRRFSVKFVPSLVHSAELVDLCGMMSSLSQLGAYTEESFGLAAKRLCEMSAQLDARQLSLVVNAYVRSGHEDQELFQKLLKQVPRRLARCTAKDAAVMLNAFAQLPGLQPKVLGMQAGDDTDDQREGSAAETAEALRIALEAVALRLPELLPSADLHSLTLILNAFAQLNFVQKDVLDLLTGELLVDEDRLQRMTPRQLAMVLNAAARLQLHEPRLLEQLASCVRLSAQSLDPHGLCVVANGCAKLELGLPTFQVLYARIPRLLTRLSGRQLAMIVHAWAKAHIHNDDLFELLALPLSKHANRLSPHEVAITLYGYAHFRKSPVELFEPLMKRFCKHISDGAVTDGDLLMAANAVGRVGWRDEVVREALIKYLQREPDSRHISVQATGTFSLFSDEALLGSTATDKASDAP